MLTYAIGIIQNNCCIQISNCRNFENFNAFLGVNVDLFLKIFPDSDGVFSIFCLQKTEGSKRLSLVQMRLQLVEIP